MAYDENLGKKYLAKLEELMTEMSADMLDEPTRVSVENKLKDILKKENVSSNLTHLKAFYQGMSIMLRATHQDNDQMAMTMMIVTKGMIGRKEKEIKKVLDKVTENGSTSNVQSDTSDASAAAETK